MRTHATRRRSLAVVVACSSAALGLSLVANQPAPALVSSYERVDLKTGAKAVGVAPAAGGGFWVALSNGQVVGEHGAKPLGKPPRITAPVTGIASTKDGRGYWLVDAKGAVYSFGDARFFGPRHPLHAVGVIVAIVASGDGYWLLSSKGGVYSFGDTHFFGSPLSLPKDRQPESSFVGLVPSAGGYDLVASNGLVVSYGKQPPKVPPLPKSGIVSVTVAPSGAWAMVGRQGQLITPPKAATAPVIVEVNGHVAFALPPPPPRPVVTGQTTTTTGTPQAVTPSSVVIQPPPPAPAPVSVPGIGWPGLSTTTTTSQSTTTTSQPTTTSQSTTTTSQPTTTSQSTTTTTPITQPPSSMQVCGSSYLQSPYSYTGSATTFTSGEYGLPTYGTSRQDTATLTVGSPTVEDSSIQSTDAGMLVYGPGIPYNATVGDVTPGAGFNLMIGDQPVPATLSATETINVGTSDFPLDTSGVIVPPGGTLPSTLQKNTIYYFEPSSTPYSDSWTWFQRNDTFIGGWANGVGVTIQGNGSNSLGANDISGDTTGIAYEYMTIEGFGSSQNGSIANEPGAPGWTWVHDDISDNPAADDVGQNVGGYALGVGSDTLIAYDCFEWDAQGALNVNHSDNVVVEHDEFGYNGFGQYPDQCGCVANAGKFNWTINSTFEDNYVHNGAGNAFWGDFNNAGLLFYGNFIADNRGGVWYEASYDAEFVDNTFVDNGWATSGEFPACPWDSSTNCTLGYGQQSEGPGGVPYATLNLSDSGGSANQEWAKNYARFSSSSVGCPSSYPNGCLIVEGNTFTDDWNPIQTYQDDGRISGGTIINQPNSPYAGLSDVYYQNWAQWQNGSASLTAGATTIGTSSSGTGWTPFYSPTGSSAPQTPSCSTETCAGTSTSPGGAGSTVLGWSDFPSCCNALPTGQQISSIYLNYYTTNPIPDGTTLMLQNESSSGALTGPEQLITVQTPNGGPVPAGVKTLPIAPVTLSTSYSFPAYLGTPDISACTSSSPCNLPVAQVDGFPASGGNVQILTDNGVVTATYSGTQPGGPGYSARGLLTGVVAAVGTPTDSIPAGSGGPAGSGVGTITYGDGTAPLFAWGPGVPTTNGGADGDPVTCSSPTSCTLSQPVSNEIKIGYLNSGINAGTSVTSLNLSGWEWWTGLSQVPSGTVLTVMDANGTATFTTTQSITGNANVSVQSTTPSISLQYGDPIYASNVVGLVQVSTFGGCGLADLFGSTAETTSGQPAEDYFDNCQIGGVRNILIQNNVFDNNTTTMGCQAGDPCSILGSIAYADGTQSWWSEYNNYEPNHVALGTGGMNVVWQDNTYELTGSGGYTPGQWTFIAGNQSNAPVSPATWTASVSNGGYGQDQGSTGL